MFGNGVKTRDPRTGIRASLGIRSVDLWGKRHSKEKDSGIFYKMPVRRLRHAPIGQPMRRRVL